MSYDIKAACTAAKKRLTRQLNKAVADHQQAIREDFAHARGEVAPVVVSAPPQRRIPLISEGTASAQRIQYGRLMFEACAASDCDPVHGECLGHCMGVLDREITSVRVELSITGAAR